MFEQGREAEVVAEESVGSSWWDRGRPVTHCTWGVGAAVAGAGTLLFSPAVSLVGADGGHRPSPRCFPMSTCRWLAGIQD